MIPTKFRFIWPIGFKCEKLTDRQQMMDAGPQVMRKVPLGK